MVTCAIPLNCIVGTKKNVFLDVTGNPVFLLTLILILYLFMLFLLQPKPNWKHKRSSWQTLRRCKRIFAHFSESLFAGKINTFFFIAFFFLLLFPARRSSDQKVINLKVKASQGKKKKKTQSNTVWSATLSRRGGGNTISLLCQYLGLLVASVTWKVQAITPGPQQTGGPLCGVCVVYLSGARVDSLGSRLLLLLARNVFL